MTDVVARDHSIIPLDYAPACRRRVVTVLAQLALMILFIAAVGGVGYSLAPPTFDPAAYLEVGPRLPFSSMGRVRNVYDLVERAALERVQQASCDFAATGSFRRMLLAELAQAGLNERESVEGLRTLRVESVEGTRLIKVTVASGNGRTSLQVANAAMGLLVWSDDKIVVDPIRRAAAPTSGTRSVLPALGLSALTLTASVFALRSSQQKRIISGDAAAGPGAR